MSNQDFNARAEMAVVRRGIAEKWPIPDSARKLAIKKIVGILDTSLDVKEVNDAAKTLVAMDKVNVTQERIYAPRISMDVSSLSTQELLNKLQGVLANDPDLRKKLMNNTKPLPEV